MVLMVPYEAFACRCEAGDVVLRESYQLKTRGKLYYACPKSKPRKNYYGCKFFLRKEERVALLTSSPGGSSTPNFSPGTSSNPISSPTPSTPPIYYEGSSSNTAIGYSSKGDAVKKVDIQAGGHENILTTSEYVKKVNEDVSEDDHFKQGPWLMAIVYLHGQWVIASGCLGNVEKYCKNGKLELVVGVVKSCTPNSLGDMTVSLKDPTCTVKGTIHYKVFQNEADGYTNSIKVGLVLILRNVSVWIPKPSQHYLNIAIRNIVKVFDKDTKF
nr:hypothetical protein [Tanacetum cinerariifolium]